jgi:hypothetical protein
MPQGYHVPRVAPHQTLATTSTPAHARVAGVAGVRDFQTEHHRPESCQDSLPLKPYLLPNQTGETFHVWKQRLLMDVHLKEPIFDLWNQTNGFTAQIRTCDR